MALQGAHTLTVDLATVTGAGGQGVLVSVELTDPRLIYPIGEPSKTLYPAPVERLTDENGIATFELLPSDMVGAYRVKFETFSREFLMPAADTRLSEIAEA